MTRMRKAGVEVLSVTEPDIDSDDATRVLVRQEGVLVLVLGTGAWRVGSAIFHERFPKPLPRSVR